MFCKWEEHWSFMDGSYFCFISLSTIGFGDLVPGDKIYGKGHDIYSEVFELSFVFCSIYLMLGMALIAMCFNLMQVCTIITQKMEVSSKICMEKKLQAIIFSTSFWAGDLGRQRSGKFSCKIDFAESHWTNL